MGKALEGASAGRVLPLVIVERESGGIVGWMKLERTPDPDGRGAELGYWLGEASQGRGYAHEAAQALLRVGFDLLDVDRVEAGAQPANAVSHHLLRKLGMRERGERQVYAPARGRWEVCLYWMLERPPAA